MPIPSNARRAGAASLSACSLLMVAALLGGCASQPDTPSLQARCRSDASTAALLEKIDARQPFATPEGLSDADAACTRARLNHAFAAKYGQPVGYKAGLTNPAVQQRFKATAPVWGALYAPMLLKDGAVVDAAFGARPLFEADMLVRVSDVRINQARTPEDVLAAIDAVIPFIELPDLMVDAPAKLNGAGLASVNVGARLGVMGAPVPVQRTAAFSNALRDGEIVISANGAELGRGRGSDVLEHPLNAVVWLTQALAAEGLSLKPGDVVSLGSFSKLMPPKAGQTVEVSYLGLPGAPKVHMTFR